MTQTHIKLDAAIVAAMIKAREVGIKMLASDCEQILSAAGIDGQFMDCGHHKSLLLTSAETGEPLYCEYCDMRDQRNDLLASAPEVGEAVEMGENTAKRFRGILSMLVISAPESDESLMLCQFSLLGMMRYKIQQIYDQPDRTAQLEAKLAERDEEIERLQSYEQGLNEVIEWMKERGLYHDADYFDEGADFAVILTEHEQQVSACAERQLEDKVKRLVEALSASNKELHNWDDSLRISAELLGDSKPTRLPIQKLINSNKALLAEMEAKG